MSATSPNKQKEFASHADSVFDYRLASPQSTVFQIARENPLDYGLQESNVRVISPDFGVEYDAQLTTSLLNQAERRWHEVATYRSLTEQLIVPSISFVLDAFDLDVEAEKIASAVYDNGYFIAAEIAEYVNAAPNQKPDAFIAFVRDVQRHLNDQAFDANGWLVGLALDRLGNMTPLEKSIFLGRYAARFANVFALAAKVIETGSDAIIFGVNVGNYVADVLSVDLALDYHYVPDLKIESITPSKVSPEGRTVDVTILGEGFNPRTDGVIFTTTYRAKLRLTDSDDADESEDFELNYLFDGGKRAKLQLPGRLFIEEGKKYDASVVFTLEEGDELSNQIEDAIEVSGEIVLDSLSKNNGFSNDLVTIKGSNFSIIPDENEIHFGEFIVQTISATKQSVTFRVPQGLDDGDFEIKVRKILSGGQYSDFSNSLFLSIAQSQVVVTVCDNGSAKDDNFALDVNGIRVGQTATTRFTYCFDFPVPVQQGWNQAMLTGLEAPDGIGTYSVQFNGASNIKGDRTSGDDLVPGSPPKFYEFFVSGQSAQTVIIKSTEPEYVPEG